MTGKRSRWIVFMAMAAGLGCAVAAAAQGHGHGESEPYASRGSTMPPYRNDLSVDDRWAVIAYQHSLSGHAGPHTEAERASERGHRH